MSEQFKILEGLPVFGPIPNQFSFSDQGACREGLVVEFKLGDKKSWIGNFQLGLTDFSAVVNHPNGKDDVVVAGGEVYVVEPFSRRLIQVFGGSVVEVLFIEEKALLVFNNNFNLIAFNKSGQLWTTRRITIDGIQNLKYDAGLILGEGLALNDEKFPFQVDINDGKILDEQRLREYLPFD
jgi:hypothetical protein